MKRTQESLERAKRSLDTAEKIIEMDVAACANRIYNAGENIAIAVISSLSAQSPKSHGKIWNAVHTLYLKGVLSSDYRPVLEDSYRLRIKGDYGKDLEERKVTITKEILKDQILYLKSFLSEAEKIIQNHENG